MTNVSKFAVKIFKLLASPGVLVFWVVVYIGLSTKMLKPVLSRTIKDEFAKVKMKLFKIFKR